MAGAEEVIDPALKEQETRATLRELFLKALGELSGKPCNIVTYEKSTLSGTFATWHPNGTEIIFRDLETPARFKISTALLRTPDVLAVEFDQPVALP
ncbi:hypothetical protein PYW07_017011 [Mythimna separata]|uniref:Gem-associated protein 7 n=1 Tax=Mythimna separata TaxID=271217 RepID=A0AAD7YVV8_MYTSE|nr:hypothetical protein PYW07_017011 [Mythimna separata]